MTKKVNKTKKCVKETPKTPGHKKGKSGLKSQDKTALESHPPGVTDEPQDKEHMDLNLIKDYPSLTQAYLTVSDNTCGLHGSEELETQARMFCDIYDSLDWEKENNLETLLEDLKAFTSKYAVAMNVADNTALGIATKSYIRQGMLFRFQKKCVKAMKLKWEDWFEENHNIRHLRSVVDYMSVAEIPNAIRYAVFGITRLKELKKVIQITDEDPDPIHTYLEKVNLAFDPACDCPIDDFKKEIDASVAVSKIKKAAADNKVEYQFNESLIRKMVFQNIGITNKVINNIHLIHDSQGSVDEYLTKKYLNGGKEFSVVEREEKTRSFKKKVAYIKEAVDIFKTDLTKLNKVEQEHIETLENSLSELKRLKNR